MLLAFVLHNQVFLDYGDLLALLYLSTNLLLVFHVLRLLGFLYEYVAFFVLSIHYKGDIEC